MYVDNEWPDIFSTQTVFIKSAPGFVLDPRKNCQKGGSYSKMLMNRLDVSKRSVQCEISSM
jgi:hypothetical protein